MDSPPNKKRLIEKRVSGKKAEHVADQRTDHTIEYKTSPLKQQLTEQVDDNQTYEQKLSEQQLHFDEIKEELNDLTNEKRTAFCDLCLKFGSRVVKWEEGVHICYECELTLCENCMKGHESHDLCVYKESEERENIREKLIKNMMREEMRESKMEEENVCIYDRVYVKHELDKKDCLITGICGLDNRRWVACDSWNSCIKIFQSGSNALLRYLRIGSYLCDVTEILVKQNSTVPDSASSSNSDISVTNSTMPDKQCLLAVTLPNERHILFIDVNKTPAIKVKNINVGKNCFGIEFCDDKIFTVCDEGPSLDDSVSVYVMSTHGVKLSVIKTGLSGSWPEFAVVPGRVYLTDTKNDKIKCIHVDGISEIKITGSGPDGICVDNGHNVYISARHHNKIYTLDFDLHGPPRQLLYQRQDYIEGPLALCIYRDKLFICHSYESSLQNVVSVVRLF